MNLDKNNIKKLLQVIDESLETNAYDKELLEIKKKLEKTDENITVYDPSIIKTAIEIKNMFSNAGFVKDSDNPTDEEIAKIRKFIGIAIDIQKDKEWLWELSQSLDKEKFLDYVDKYNERIALAYKRLTDLID